MPIALADETLARFRSSVEALAGHGSRIGLAVSGGGDSLALLVLAHAVMPERIEVATVDHRLRPEASDEAALVASICASLGLIHSVLTPSAPITGSLQANARKARYAALEAWANERELVWVATAHHVDDQAETLMMRLMRGSGLAGLSAIRASNGTVIRPLLNWRRSELHAIVIASGFEPVDDRSNHDPHFDRVSMRRALVENSWIDPIALAKSAAYLSEANDALNWATQREAERRLSIDSAGIAIDPQQLPAEITRRLILIALFQLNLDISPRGAQISKLIEVLERGGKTELSGVKCSGGTIWHFALAPPRLTK